MWKLIWSVVMVCALCGCHGQNENKSAANAESAVNQEADTVVIKQRVKEIYDGTFTGRKIPGHGICAVFNGEKLLAGNAELMKDENIAFQPCDETGTKVYVATDGRGSEWLTAFGNARLQVLWDDHELFESYLKEHPESPLNAHYAGAYTGDVNDFVFVIMLDEPTSALDPELIGEVLNVIRQLAEDGMTMIIVTHEITFARSVATDILFMDNGTALVQTDTKSFFESSENKRVSEFLSSISERMFLSESNQTTQKDNRPAHSGGASRGKRGGMQRKKRRRK